MLQLYTNYINYYYIFLYRTNLKYYFFKYYRQFAFFLGIFKDRPILSHYIYIISLSWLKHNSNLKTINIVRARIHSKYNYRLNHGRSNVGGMRGIDPLNDFFLQYSQQLNLCILYYNVNVLNFVLFFIPPLQ
jgi:hypothetical protein